MSNHYSTVDRCTVEVRHHMRAALSSRRGQSMVETALILPVFLLLIFGTIDIGRAVYTHTLLSHAVRDGCRVAVISSRPTSQVIQTVVQAAVGANLPASNVTVAGTRTSGSTVRVSAFVTFTPLTPLIQSLLPGPLTLRASSAMIVN